ncbi:MULTISPECIES: hypothetical protein [Methylobacteriaceae]|uniref:Uncharacterized protein n=1 Tax=Methylorubrum populi TaxID=223967 RepID=A0A161JLF2_9HYPH|nr:MULTISPECIES: hypothetical protein [Methylobacteriaceae]MBY0255760.1 hypothetical protein [Methylobacterium organophilum]MDV2984009.1 hypothetical protein [Methylobacteriaceae bacterium AG10]BAU89073.1 hypothetical protein MPPM_0468 [Methylorubrum populi]
MFDLPWDVLVARNEAWAALDPTHRRPEHVLRLTYEAMRARDAWWRALPREQIEVVTG